MRRPTGPKPMDLKSISMSSSPLSEMFVFPNNEGAMKKPLDDNFPFKPSPRDETGWTKSGGKRKKEKENDDEKEEEEELARVPPPMFSTAKKKKKKKREDDVFRVFEAPPPKYAEEEDEEEEVIVLTARKKTKRKTASSSRFAIFDGGFRGFDEDDEGKTKKKKKKKRKFDEDEEDEEGGEMKKEETIRRAVPATLPFPTSPPTTKKNEKIKQDDDDGNKTAKRRRRCSSNSAAAAADTNNNTNNKNSNAEFEKKIELALEREKASGSGRDVMASKSGAIANSPPTAAAVLVPPPVVAGAAMVFDASKTATTDDVARMKKKPATKSYKNFASKKPPSSSSKGFPAFDVAAAVAKKKAQIEAAKVQVGFGSSARKPAGIDPIPTKKPVVSASGSFRLGASSSSASKRAKCTINSGVGSPFEVQQQQQQQQPVSEFQKMIQKARENLESSKAAEMLRSPAPITTAAVAPSPAAVERSTQRSLKMSTPSSSFARAPNAGKHQRFTSPPSAAAAAAAPKAKVAASSVEQQRKQQPRQQPMPPPAASVKFPVNQTLVFAATNSGNGAGVVDIVAKAKQKTYDPSTAEKAKKKAKEMYDKKLLDAERKEKLGQLSALDATLSSKAPSGVRDLVPRSFASSHDDATAAGENKKKTASSMGSRVFGGAMTKAQKAHMAMEWEPL